MNKPEMGGVASDQCKSKNSEKEAIEIVGVTEDETEDFEEQTLDDSGHQDGESSEESVDLDPDQFAKRRRTQSRIDVAEDDEDSNHECINNFLDKCNDQAEARLAARRLARAEAREIRMRELERQQREQEENADRAYDMLAEPITRSGRASSTTPHRIAATTGITNSSYLSSRRSSEDSLEDGGSLRDVRHELKELEDKFRKAMIANAQLDNDKAAQTYQLELLKDRIEELEEEYIQLKREHRETCREHDQLKRVSVRLKEELAAFKAELEERDRLIAEKGLVIVGEAITEDESGAENNTPKTPKKALVSLENAAMLENAGEGSLDVRLKRFAEEKRDLMDQLSHLRLELEEERSRRKRRTSSMNNASLQNGPSLEADGMDVIDVQREANKQLADYKFRVQKSEQDIATLQATVARLESQVIRYKSAAEASEKAEDELKVEKRKLQREVLNATLFSAVLFIIFPKLDIYGSLYFVQKQILGVTILTKTVVATLLVLFGFFASYKKNYVYLTLYGSVMFLIFLLDIALIIIYITFTEFEIFHNYSETQMVYHFSNLDNENSKHLFSSIQQKLQCCGINGPEDYKNGSEVNVPVSCCANNKCKNILSIYLNGCLKTFLNHPVPGLVFVNSVFLILFFIEILSLLITLRYVLKIIDFSKTNVFHPL